MQNLYSKEEKTVTERRHSGKRRTPISPIYKIIIVVLAAAFVFSTVQYLIKRQKLVAKKEALLESIKEQEDLSKLYTAELEKVGSPEYYEYMARKKLGYIYPDEKILIVTEDSSTEPQHE